MWRGEGRCTSSLQPSLEAKPELENPSRLLPGSTLDRHRFGQVLRVAQMFSGLEMLDLSHHRLSVPVRRQQLHPVAGALFACGRVMPFRLPRSACRETTEALPQPHCEESSTNITTRHETQNPSTLPRALQHREQAISGATLIIASASRCWTRHKRLPCTAAHFCVEFPHVRSTVEPYSRPCGTEEAVMVQRLSRSKLERRRATKAATLRANREQAEPPDLLHAGIGDDVESICDVGGCSENSDSEESECQLTRVSGSRMVDGDGRRRHEGQASPCAITKANLASHDRTGQARLRTSPSILHLTNCRHPSPQEPQDDHYHNHYQIDDHEQTPTQSTGCVVTSPLFASKIKTKSQ